MKKEIYLPPLIHDISKFSCRQVLKKKFTFSQNVSLTVSISLIASLSKSRANDKMGQISLDEEGTEDQRILDSLSVGNKKRVFISEDGVLTWPVKLIYPEHKTSDFIEQFREVTV